MILFSLWEYWDSIIFSLRRLFTWNSRWSIIHSLWVKSERVTSWSSKTIYLHIQPLIRHCIHVLLLLAVKLLNNFQLNWLKVSESKHSKILQCEISKSASNTLYLYLMQLILDCMAQIKVILMGQKEILEK